MAIIRPSAAELNGTTVLSSSAGRGTSVTLTLPVGELQGL